eukprot:g10330.t1
MKITVVRAGSMLADRRDAVDSVAYQEIPAERSAQQCKACSGGGRSLWVFLVAAAASGVVLGYLWADYNIQDGEPSLPTHTAGWQDEVNNNISSTRAALLSLRTDLDSLQAISKTQQTKIDSQAAQIRQQASQIESQAALLKQQAAQLNQQKTLLATQATQIDKLDKAQQQLVKKADIPTAAPSQAPKQQVGQKFRICLRERGDGDYDDDDRCSGWSDKPRWSPEFGGLPTRIRIEATQDLPHTTHTTTKKGSFIACFPAISYGCGLSSLKHCHPSKAFYSAVLFRPLDLLPSHLLWVISSKAFHSVVSSRLIDLLPFPSRLLWAVHLRHLPQPFRVDFLTHFPAILLLGFHSSVLGSCFCFVHSKAWSLSFVSC